MENWLGQSNRELLPEPGWEEPAGADERILAEPRFHSVTPATPELLTSSHCAFRDGLL
jgi:hypothetical protein